MMLEMVEKKRKSVDFFCKLAVLTRCVIKLSRPVYHWLTRSVKYALEARCLHRAFDGKRRWNLFSGVTGFKLSSFFFFLPFTLLFLEIRARNTNRKGFLSSAYPSSCSAGSAPLFLDTPILLSIGQDFSKTSIGESKRAHHFIQLYADGINKESTPLLVSVVQIDEFEIQRAARIKNDVNYLFRFKSEYQINLIFFFFNLFSLSSIPIFLFYHFFIAFVYTRFQSIAKMIGCIRFKPFCYELANFLRVLIHTGLIGDYNSILYSGLYGV